MQPAEGVTENVALVTGLLAAGAVRVSEELVRATVSPPPGDAGKPMRVVLDPLSAANGVTVMTPGVTAPVISLQLTATAGVTVNFGKVMVSVTTEVASMVAATPAVN